MALSRRDFVQNVLAGGAATSFAGYATVSSVFRHKNGDNTPLSQRRLAHETDGAKSLSGSGVLFEVAVFSLSRPGETSRRLSIHDNGFDMQNRPLRDLIRFAFAKGRGAAYRVSSQPSWVDNVRYDVSATVSPESLAEWQKLDRVGQKVALRGFLAQHVGLQYHHDDRNHSHYVLAIDKAGSTGDPRSTALQPVSYRGRRRARLCRWEGGSQIVAQASSMDRLAEVLSTRTDRPVLDKTELTGNYRFTIKCDLTRDLSSDAATARIGSAVRQAGLSLLPARGPMDGLVIDHIERPVESWN